MGQGVSADKYSGEDNSGKVAVVTGANTGLGRVSARELLRSGYKVILACRSSERGGVVEVVDLNDLESVGAFGEKMNQELERLDLLMLNAGVMAIQGRQETKQKLEKTGGINHFGHCYLYQLLEEKLVKSQPSRLVVLTSGAHFWAPKEEGIYLDDFHFEKHPYDRWEAYGQSKLANVLFAREADRRFKDRGDKVFTYAVHPGFVNTDLLRNYGNFVTVALGRMFASVAAKTVEEGALTQLRCALDPSVFNAKSSGQYWVDENISDKRTEFSYDDDLAQKLWDLTEETIFNLTKNKI